MILKTKNQVKGTRVLVGKDADLFREVTSNLIVGLLNWTEDASEIILPLIEPYSIYESKNMENKMYVFEDNGNRKLCLRSEATASIQAMLPQFNGKKDVILYYLTQCYRYDKPQEGRYREFWQFGVEYLNPSNPPVCYQKLKNLAIGLVEDTVSTNFENHGQERNEFKSQITFKNNVERGWDYYKEGKGFEIECDVLGAQKQLVGGGVYEGGAGFAIGVDRLILANQKLHKYDD